MNEDLPGLELPEAELQALLVTYEEIAREIRKLRSLDLTEIHPAVVFDPLLPYRTDAE